MNIFFLVVILPIARPELKQPPPNTPQTQAFLHVILPDADYQLPFNVVLVFFLLLFPYKRKDSSLLHQRAKDHIIFLAYSLLQLFMLSSDPCKHFGL